MILMLHGRCVRGSCPLPRLRRRIERRFQDACSRSGGVGRGEDEDSNPDGFRLLYRLPLIWIVQSIGLLRRRLFL